jgi:hypothetical protein
MSLFACLCLSAPALAEPSPPPPAAAPAPAPEHKPWKEWLAREKPLPLEAEQQSTRMWYGWQTLLVDGISMGVVALSTIGEETGAVWFGLGMLLITSPIVHFAHMNIVGGFTSLAIRAVSSAMFVFGASIATGDAFSEGSGDRDTEGTVLAAAGLLGMTTAVVVDAAVFAYEEPMRGQSRAVLTPWFDPARGRIGLGYAAAF